MSYDEDYDEPPREDEDFEPFIDPEIQEDPDSEHHLQAAEDAYEKNLDRMLEYGP